MKKKIYLFSSKCAYRKEEKIGKKKRATIVLKNINVYPIVLVAWQNDFQIVCFHFDVINVGNKFAQVSHVTT